MEPSSRYGVGGEGIDTITTITGMGITIAGGKPATMRARPPSRLASARIGAFVSRSWA